MKRIQITLAAIALAIALASCKTTPTNPDSFLAGASASV
jgi:hypothetical protein